MRWSRRDKSMPETDIEEPLPVDGDVDEDAEDPNALSVTLIGRPQAGKSLLVGALLRQAHNSLHSFDHLNPMFIANRGNDTDELISLMNRFLRGDKVPATYTHRTPNYRVRLTCAAGEEAQPRRWLIGRTRPSAPRLADIVITDAAGGLLMGGSAGNQSREDMRLASRFVNRVKRSRGLVYCLPVDMTELDLDADYKQINVIKDLVVDNELALERVVICLTKYESLWANAGLGTEALDRAREPDAFMAIAREKLPQGLMQALLALSERPSPTDSRRRIEVCVSPVSAFGFVKNNGCVNFNPHSKGLLVEAGHVLPTHPHCSLQPPYYADGVAADYWQPFHIVDPFVYAAFGDKGRLTVDVRDLG